MGKSDKYVDLYPKMWNRKEKIYNFKYVMEYIYFLAGDAIRELIKFLPYT